MILFDCSIYMFLVALGLFGECFRWFAFCCAVVCLWVRLLVMIGCLCDAVVLLLVYLLLLDRLLGVCLLLRLICGLIILFNSVVV